MGRELIDLEAFKNKGEAVEQNAEAFLHDLILDKSRGSKNTVTVENIGQVESLAMPEKWQEKTYQPAADGSSFRQFQTADQQSSLNFYYRGQRVDKASAQAFKETLVGSEHIVMEKELEPLKQILRNKDAGSGFELGSAQTREINGKMVLQVEGTYRKQKIDTVALYVDADGSGSAIQEIYYQGPQGAREPKREAKKAFDSIHWK